jgi:eukaryotic-like serine/threonine-protein kinase
VAEASRVAGTGEGIAGHAINEALVGLTAAARARVDATDDEGLLTSATLDEQVVLAAVSGDTAAGRALRPKVTAEIINAPNANPTVARVMRALVALADGEPADVVAVLEPVAFEASRADEVTIWVLAQLRQQRWAEAAKGLTFLDEQRRRTDISAFPAFVLVSLGRAHAALGDPAAARAAYQAFFDLWRDADVDVPLLVQAREEFAKLGT